MAELLFQDLSQENLVAKTADTALRRLEEVGISALQICEPEKECPEIKTPMIECANSNRNNQATLLLWDTGWLGLGFCMLISDLI